MAPLCHNLPRHLTGEDIILFSHCTCLFILPSITKASYRLDVITRSDVQNENTYSSAQSSNLAIDMQDPANHNNLSAKFRLQSILCWQGRPLATLLCFPIAPDHSPLKEYACLTLNYRRRNKKHYIKYQYLIIYRQEHASSSSLTRFLWTHMLNSRRN